MTAAQLNKSRRFFFHFNRPATLTAGTPKLSVHFNKQCLIVDKIVCGVPVESKINKTQPRVVMQGYANNFTLVHELDGTDKFEIANIHYI